LAQGYIDLGLPNNTLWRKQNEGGDKSHYRYDKAKSLFRNHLPTHEQWSELIHKM
jgi:hypothetical protein